MSLSSQLAIVVVAWIVGLVSSLLGLRFGIVNPGRRFRTSLALAITAMAIGFLGCGYWTPVRLLPQIAYTWSSGDSEFAVASGWFFIGPLLLGAGALLLAIRGRRKAKRAAVPNAPGNAG